MKRLRKILMILIIALLVLGMMSQVKAFSVYEGEVEQYIKTFLGKQHFYSTAFSDGVLFCIQWGGSFNSSSTTITKADYDKYINTYLPEDKSYDCQTCEATELPWSGNKYYIKYEAAEGLIDALSHQDEAYNLANIFEEQGTIITEIAAEATWASSVSLVVQQFAAGEEGKAYMKFYEDIKPSFENKLKDLTGEVKIGVNQQTQKYTIGPLKMQYPDGQYGGVNKFDYIENLIVYTNAGQFSIEQGNLEILNNRNEKIDIQQLDYKKSDTLNNKEYYLRFQSTGATRVDKIDVMFQYLDHCDAKMQEYIGHTYKVWWKAETKGPNNPATSKHPEVDCNGHEKDDPEGGTYLDENGIPHKKKITEYYAGTRYRCTEEPLGETQRLMLAIGTAQKIWKQAILTMVPSGIDLTMKLSGTVFLDQDTGKINLGNNLFDKNNQEALPGVEVTLCDANGNPVALPYVIKHTHTGDPTKGTGCYTTPVYHTHSGSTTSYGTCYAQASHIHSGNEIDGGACFTEPIYHQHYRSCLKQDKDGNLLDKYNNIIIEDVKIDENTKVDANGYIVDKNGNRIPTQEILTCNMDGKIVGYKNTCAQHIHKGNAKEGGACFDKPVYHVHTLNCVKDEIVIGSTKIKKDEIATVKDENGNDVTIKDENDKEVKVIKTDDEGNIFRKTGEKDDDGNDILEAIDKREALICGKTTATFLGYYEKTCTKESITYTKTCDKQEGVTIDYYLPSCGKTEDVIEQNLVQPHTQLSNKDGFYEFQHLNAMQKYYVRFTYNGMLYTNVIPEKETEANHEIVSKSTEEAQGHSGNRANFNSLFKEIGSYPHNYKIRNKVFGESLGDYNKVYLQEEVADLFKEVARKFGDVSSWNNADEETKRKVQFVMDCRISAYSINRYPLIDIFTIDYTPNVIAGEQYLPIYSGTYCQLHINLGIKSRHTFDLNLSQDVYQSKLDINGKSTIYTYGKREDKAVKVQEDFYLNQIRDKYINEDKNTDELIKSLNNDAITDDGSYNHEFRREEIVNGNNQNNAITNHGMDLFDEDEDNILDEDDNEDNQVDDDTPKDYQWRDINYGLKDGDKLKIHITYKLTVTNTSGVVGAITEVVDYFDSNYEFENAYVGDKDGKEIGKVIASDTSMYGEATRMRDPNGNGAWRVGKDKETVGYKTKYLRPENEQKLYKDNTEQYIYVTFGLINPEATLIQNGVPDGNKFFTYNMAEINGYRSYVLFDEYNHEYYKTRQQELESKTMGLIDRNSNPGNFNPDTYVYKETELEDDETRAPAYVYSVRISRTMEGNVFEEALSNERTNRATASKEDYIVNVGTTRFGDGRINFGKNEDKRIAGIKVELVEIKDQKMYVRSTTYTDKNGWYGFGAYLPGDYTIRFTYGADEQTALTKDSQYKQEYLNEFGGTFRENFENKNGGKEYGKEYIILNDTSYNGQDYQATEFRRSPIESNTEHVYTTDDVLKGVYETNNSNKNSEEHVVLAPENQKIVKYENSNYYWYDDTSIKKSSDARDDEARRSQVISYAKTEYGKEIINHKAEVFNSYINQKTLRENERNSNFNEFTQAQPTNEHVDNYNHNKELVKELERRNYMYAYTAEIPIEIEYTEKELEGGNDTPFYTYKVTGVDFGIVERPRTQLTIDQDIKHIKVTTSDGNTILELANNNDGTFKVLVDNGNNYQWLHTAKTDTYEKDELINVILDDELLSGSKLEVTYNITVTNNSEAHTGIQRAKNIINYVANNLNFDLADNNGLWTVVKKEEIQTPSSSTLINNDKGQNVNLVDLSTQTTILKASENNPLTSTALNPGQSATSTLTLKKTISAESSMDDLTYNNMTEIVEIDSTNGRYDHGAIPGNQSLEEQPREHDASGASRYDEINQESGLRERYKYDGRIIITPPTGSKRIYYVLATTVAFILIAGIVLIKKFVMRKDK